MDHPLAAPDSPIRLWRTVAYVATAIAAFELMVLLVIGGGALVTTVSNKVEKAAVKRALSTPAAVEAYGEHHPPAGEGRCEAAAVEGPACSS